MFNRHDEPIDAPGNDRVVESNDNLTGTPPPLTQRRPVAAGFVRCVHPDVVGTADLPVRALDRYRSRGWAPVSTNPQED